MINRKFTADDKNRKFGVQNGECAGCRTRFDKRHLCAVRVIPPSAGGGCEYKNLALLCYNCKSIKGARPMKYLRARLKTLLENRT
ncbi:MAG: hypothetical protein ACR2P5_03180 [Gammaproteobacteria bacterium]